MGDKKSSKKHLLQQKEARKAWLFLLPSLLGITVFVLLPFSDVIRRSFCEAMSQSFTGLSNYRTVLANKAFLLAVKNTARFELLCIPLLLSLSLILALLLYSQQKYAGFFKTTFMIPLAIPAASMVLIWKLLFHEKGLLNVLLLHFGITGSDYMNTDKAFYVLVFSYLWKNTGYDMVLWLSGLNGINPSLYEAADADGAGAWQKFRYITFPLLTPSLFMIGILSFINSFKVYREAYLISGNYPHESIYLLQHLFNNWFTSLDIQKMSAAAVLYVLFFVGLLSVLQLFDRDTE
ncbi:carbohydrate ABC transporter permease [Anaerocolumna chitinilytica]|nr:sugar ABC transporter permease [Anaerocolumna chitinilytica]